MTGKYRVGVIGNGYVGQHFVSLLSDHPWFEIKYLFASERYMSYRMPSKIGLKPLCHLLIQLQILCTH